MTKFIHDIPNEFRAYLERMQAIKRGGLPKGGLAPHKPVLLLAIFDVIENMDENQFKLNDSLMSVFRKHWKILVGTKFEIRHLLYPLFHLQTDGFWFLKDRSGNIISNFDQISSGSRLKELDAFARLEDSFFNYLTDPDLRQIAKLTVIFNFFPESQESFLQKNPHPVVNQLKDLENEVLREPHAKYGTINSKYEGYLRDMAFRRMVLNQYRYTCAVSGLHISGYPAMVEAAHIEPFSLTGNNHITNGITLCPNLHRAFDLGLITLTEKYRVKISKSINESRSLYPLGEANGMKIKLPENQKFWPAQEHIRWHQKNVFQR